MKTSSRLAGALIAPLLALQFQAHAQIPSSAEAPPPAESAPAAEDADILERLRALPGVLSVAEAPTRYPGTRFFQLEMDQPVDHQHPEGPHFRQRLTLLHRSESAPMVLLSNGYGISMNASQRELTYLVQGNQLLVEHRFFTPSAPEPFTWEHLTIAQAAADHHRIVAAFKPLYGAKWVSTGASKGGMTSVYHRFFYPQDVDATVPYVAPNSHGTADARYVEFVANAGNDSACNEKLRVFQKTALQHREELLPLVSQTYEPQGITFDIFGEDRALEFSVVELPYAFWQYGNTTLCPLIPGEDASAEEMFGFIEYIVGVGFLGGDLFLNYYAPYYYQSATELGAPRYDERHLHGLLRYPRQDRPGLYPPLGVDKPFDHALMHQVERWVRTDGQRMLFIYGENDPWSTGAFEVRARNDSLRFFVPAGNHGSSLLQLPEPQRTQALDALQRWMGVSVIRPASTLAAEALPIDPPGREELFLR